MSDFSLGDRVGSRIRDLRRRISYTQEKLAEQARISVSFLSMIERGERIPRLETFASLANALGVDLHEMFVGTYEHSSTKNDVLRPLIVFLEDLELSSPDVERLLTIVKAIYR